MYKNKTIGIVILNYNDAFTTIKLCNLIRNYEVIDRIVVVDNFSKDNSFEILQKLEDEKIKVIQSDRNGGYSYGNNFGAFYLINNYCIDIIFISNPDVEFDQTFLEIASNDLIIRKLDAVTGIMLNSNGKEYYFNGTINTYFEDLMDCTVLLKTLINKFKKKQILIQDDLMYCDILPGSLFGIKAKIFNKINGFDENVFLYCEERILGTKLKSLNCNVAINRKISFYHLHSVRINKSITKIKQLKQLYISKLYFYKNYKNIGFFKYIIMKVFMIYGILIRKILYKILY